MSWILRKVYHNNGFKKNVNFFEENLWKSRKIDENRRKLVKIAENWWKSQKIDETRRKLMKIADNWWKSQKNDENRWKLMKITENWWKSQIIVIITSTPEPRMYTYSPVAFFPGHYRRSTHTRMRESTRTLSTLASTTSIQYPTTTTTVNAWS
jgi:hypothetical protein